MKIALVLGSGVTESNLKIAAQLGADEVATHVSRSPSEPWGYLPIIQLKQKIEDAGLSWSVVETLRVTDAVKLGLADRDRDMEVLCTTIQNLGAAGIPVAVYTWTAALPWLRTSFTTPVRGGGLATSYDHRLMQDAPPTKYGQVPESQLWDSMEYFLKTVVPVAEEAGVHLALHPDDPPLSPICGMGRIMISPENFQKVIDLVPSKNNGITFCQGCFAEMGVDVPAQIRHFVSQGKIHFAHFRNIRGTAENFTEQFHDDGDIDMYAVLKAFSDSGYTGSIRPDHVPTMEGAADERPGYGMLGRHFAVGYMRGLLDAIGHQG